MIERVRSAKRIGLLFSGGSARCVFQVGVVEALTELRIAPSICLGVSGGAWNAAAVAAGNAARLRHYWRFFCRMPYIDLTNLMREHSPFIWPRLHERAFRRYVGEEKIRSGLPLYVAMTRLRDRAPVIMDVREARDPFRILLASNYLPPFYTHPLIIDGERYGDGGMTNNVPYDVLLDRGCDLVIVWRRRAKAKAGCIATSPTPITSSPTTASSSSAHVIASPSASSSAGGRSSRRSPIWEGCARAKCFSANDMPRPTSPRAARLPPRMSRGCFGSERNRGNACCRQR